MQNNTFSGLFVGQNLVSLTEVDSTNNFLKQSLANSTPLIEGTVIMAESQYAGRGQRQNQWHSQPGKNLTFSILLKPTFLPLNRQFNLNVAISVGIIKAIEKVLGPNAKIKWPNDIYFGSNKLGGVLIENMVQGSQIKNAIVGIGINVNQTIFEDGAANAISVKQILHKDYELKALLAEICNEVEVAYLMLRSENFEPLQAFYLQKLYWLNELRPFAANGITFNGIIKDVNPNGLLCIETNNELIQYNFKEIEFLNKPTPK
ncbi:biotin--[acetyl-CoA-carboxylase] ligase [Mucilaginibacter gracilis]|uniref:biotin--[acetyl-CoA-carboxylase] ligase n=1 Tax=Mucilaginibacter gracilis TaxID=423350 RepID=UPI001FE31605|nr:biotin--[acetyl-CoA-carboxylase] ligase [Mucilaginibacter gracilis]